MGDWCFLHLMGRSNKTWCRVCCTRMRPRLPADAAALYFDVFDPVPSCQVYPMAGAVLGTCLGGPVGVLAGIKIGGLAAIGGSIFGGW